MNNIEIIASILEELAEEIYGIYPYRYFGDEEQASYLRVAEKLINKLTESGREIAQINYESNLRS